MTKIEELFSNMREAANELGVTIRWLREDERPELERGRFILIEKFGSLEGTLVGFLGSLEENATVWRHFQGEGVGDTHAGVSLFGRLGNVVWGTDSLMYLLAEWGYAGPSSEEPHWYRDEVEGYERLLAADELNG